jgi:predicted ArsR family transcriptional regulator
VLYALTPQAESLFPKAYSALFNRLVRLLRRQGADVGSTLAELGAELGTEEAARTPSGDRAQRAVAAIGEMGGLARLEQDGVDLIIEGASCPFAEAVAEHPEVCSVATQFVSRLLDAPVREECDHDRAACRFRILGGAHEKTG